MDWRQRREGEGWARRRRQRRAGRQRGSGTGSARQEGGRGGERGRLAGATAAKEAVAGTAAFGRATGRTSEGPSGGWLFGVLLYVRKNHICFKPLYNFGVQVWADIKVADVGYKRSMIHRVIFFVAIVAFQPHFIQKIHCAQLRRKFYGVFEVNIFVYVILWKIPAPRSLVFFCAPFIHREPYQVNKLFAVFAGIKIVKRIVNLMWIFVFWCATLVPALALRANLD